MLNVFWETEEVSPVKKEIEKKLIFLKKELFRSSFFSAQKQRSLAVIFCDAKRIREINKLYRQKDISTDVLSFSEIDFKNRDSWLEESDSLGEIFINYDWLKKGKDHGLKGLSELFVHGALHLIGFDHETDGGEMRKAEKEILGIIRD